MTVATSFPEPDHGSGAVELHSKQMFQFPLSPPFELPLSVPTTRLGSLIGFSGAARWHATGLGALSASTRRLPPHASLSHHKTGGSPRLGQQMKMGLGNKFYSCLSASIGSSAKRMRARVIVATVARVVCGVGLLSTFGLSPGQGCRRLRYWRRGRGQRNLHRM